MTAVRYTPEAIDALVRAARTLLALSDLEAPEYDLMVRALRPFSGDQSTIPADLPEAFEDVTWCYVVPF